MRPQRAPQQQTRTREDRAKALCSRLIMATDQRVLELIGDHTAESFAKANGLPAHMIRPAFEHAAKRRAAHDNLV